MACNPFGGGEPEVSQQLVEVVRGDLTVSVSGSGSLDVSSEVSLAFGSGGKVDKINIEEGDKVSKGDVLAQLDTSSLELALTQAEVALVQAEVALVQAEVARDQAEYDLNQLKDVLHASYDRIKIAELQLELTGLQIELTESQIEAAEQSVAQAQKQLEEAIITAPFDGVVASVYADEGDIIPPPTMAAKEIIHLIDLTTMELKVEVDEIDIPGMEPNQRAIIEVDALPALPLEGKVSSISLLPAEEAGVIVYDVKIEFHVPEGTGLRAGMSATADIIIYEKNNVLLAPSRAIKQDSQGNPVVKVMVDEEIEERPVVTGISDGFQTEIVDGLKEGEVVVVERRGG